MHGSPLLRTLVVVLLLSFAAVPLWRLTRARESGGVVAATAEPAAKSGVRIELAFAHPPSGFQVTHLGKVIWESQTPGASARKDFKMEFPKEGIDLGIKATWPAGTPLTAVRVNVTPEGGNPLQQTAWGTGTMDEVLTFHDL